MNKTKERPTSQLITVNIDKLSAMLSCGHATARKTGRIAVLIIYVSYDIWYNMYRHNHVMRTKRRLLQKGMFLMANSRKENGRIQSCKRNVQN